MKCSLLTPYNVHQRTDHAPTNCFGCCRCLAVVDHHCRTEPTVGFRGGFVKKTNNGPSNFVPQRSGDLIIMHNTRLFAIFNYAYRLTETYQMEGYDRFQEGWKWYDIEARARGGATDDQVRLMFQSLLADRFKVRVHRETKEIPGFELLTDKGKSKLTRTSSEGPMKATIEGIPVSQAAGTCGGSMLHEGVRMICHAVSMNTIAPQFSAQMHAPVVDHTGLYRDLRSGHPFPSGGETDSIPMLRSLRLSNRRFRKNWDSSCKKEKDLWKYW